MLRLWGENLTRRRRELRLSQSDIAEDLGVAQQTYSRWEQGLHAPPDHVRVGLAKLLGSNVYELFPYPDLQEHDA